MRALRVTSNIILIFSFLLHVTENLVTNFCTALSDPRTKHKMVVYLPESSRKIIGNVRNDLDSRNSNT